MRPLCVATQPKLKQTAWAGIAFFSLCCCGAAWIGLWWAFVGHLSFAGYHASLLLRHGPIEADSEGVWQTTSSGRYEIKWSEVTKIEVSPGTELVLHGNNKRLALPGTAMWQEEGKQDMIQFIDAQAKAWDIPCEKTTRASYQMSKNTKIAPRNQRPPLSP